MHFNPVNSVNPVLFFLLYLPQVNPVSRLCGNKHRLIDKTTASEKLPQNGRWRDVLFGDGFKIG